MYRLLIFGGTTEGRLLAEFCSENMIYACVSVTTDYGAALLYENEYIRILNGRLDRDEIAKLIKDRNFGIVVDATHPYAVIATENIRFACDKTGAKYYRLKRESDNKISGTVFDNYNELVEYLNRNNKRILSTLGSKELPVLSGVYNCFERVWLRVLPADGIAEYCKSYGFDGNKIISEKGPFTVEENTEHIRKSGAEILITKESGVTGGYPEKVKAAERLGIEIVTIKRPKESGFMTEEIKKLILKELR